MTRALLSVALTCAWCSAVGAGEPARLKSLSIDPGEVVLAGARAQQQLLVTGHYDDGSVRDLTAKATYQSSRTSVVLVDESGRLRPLANGGASVTATCQGLTATVAVRIERLEDQSYNFQRDILPVLSRAGCNQMGCHGSPKGKAGFRLSLFGAEPDADYEAIARGGMGRLLSLHDPAASLLVLKGTGAVPHGGDVRLKPGSGEVRLLADWIANGAPRGTKQDPTLTRIEVFPKQRTLAVNASQPLLVEAYYSDGTMADVTHLASVISSDDQIAALSHSGLAQAQGPGEAILLVTYAGQVTVSRLAIPQTHSTSFPQTPTHNRIDELVLNKLRLLNITPSDLCSDAEFLRRVYLDVLGVLPTPDEARAFHQDTSPDKRARLIDALLQRPELVDSWTLKWGDLLRINRGFPINLGEKSMQAYHKWVRQSLAENKPINLFVRELLTAQGVSNEVGPANFFRTVRDPQGLAEQAATVFLGIRLDCAHCHNHPFEQITWDDNYGMSAFFARVKIKRAPKSKDDDEVTIADKGEVRHVGNGKPVTPRFLDGTFPKTTSGDLRVALADWITAPENPWFARNIANRIWAWTVGRGLVHEPDDFRSTNPPSNPELLDYLASELVRSGYDMKHVLKLILQSRTYQLSSRTNASNAQDNVHFSHYSIKRLSAEQLLDAISQATGVAEKFPNMPAGTRAAQLPDGNVRSAFLDAFGRPKRAQTCECERSTEMHVGQTLQLLSSDVLESRLASPTGRIALLVKSGKTNDQIVEELFLATLSRLPSARERSIALASVSNAASRQAWAQDLLWTLLNTKEFLFNH